MITNLLTIIVTERPPKIQVRHGLWMFAFDFGKRLKERNVFNLLARRFADLFEFGALFTDNDPLLRVAFHVD